MGVPEKKEVSVRMWRRTVIRDTYKDWNRLSGSGGRELNLCAKREGRQDFREIYHWDIVAARVAAKREGGR